MPSHSILTCDVLVAGGGSAGIAAAVSAARAGAKTILIERHGFLGGMGTAALVHTICGLYLLREAEGPVEANPGFATEFARRLIASGGAKGPVRMGRLDVLPHDPWSFALLADELVKECPNLQVLLHSEIHAATADGQSCEVSVVSRGSLLTARAAMAIDTTGDATLTALLGAGWQQVPPDRLQRPAYIVKLASVNANLREDATRLRLAHAMAMSVKAGTLPREALGAGFRAGLRPGECYLTVDLAGDAADGTSYDPTDAATLSLLEQTGRRAARALTAWLAASQEGFGQAHVTAWPARAGIRESRRMVGRYELSSEDVLQGRAFVDGIALATWPMELREKPTGPRWRFPEGDRPVQVPLRCLRSLSHPMLFAAGRCLSASHEAMASLRVMGTCMATGEAAGIAAALMTQDASLLEGSDEVLAAMIKERRMVN